MKSGSAYYSKKLGSDVVYIGKVAGRDEFVTRGYFLRTYTLDEVGELDPLVRNCHYEAMVEKNKLFIDSMTNAFDFQHENFDSEYAQGWWDCLAYVTQHLWETENAVNG